MCIGDVGRVILPDRLMKDGAIESSNVRTKRLARLDEDPSL